MDFEAFDMIYEAAREGVREEYSLVTRPSPKAKRESTASGPESTEKRAREETT